MVLPAAVDKHSLDLMEALLVCSELDACRQRVLDAGCELKPAWAGGAFLLVPLTREMFSELELELKPHHALLLLSDVDVFKTALLALPCRQRPSVRDDHRATWRQSAADASVAHGNADETQIGNEQVEGSPVGRQAAAAASDHDFGNACADEEPSADLEEEDDTLKRFGVVVENSFLRYPGNATFDVSVASSSQIANSAPSGLRSGGDAFVDLAAERSARLAPSARNPRRFKAPGGQ